MRLAGRGVIPERQTIIIQKKSTPRIANLGWKVAGTHVRTHAFSFLHSLRLDLPYIAKDNTSRKCALLYAWVTSKIVDWGHRKVFYMDGYLRHELGSSDRRTHKEIGL